MCFGRFNNVRSLSLLVSFGLLSLSSVNVLAQEDHFRFASNRLVMVQLSNLEQGVHSNCRQIRQKGSFETSFPSLHLHGTGPLRIVDMAVGLDDTVMIVGVFSGLLGFEGQSLQASGSLTPFYLILDHQGLPIAFEKLDGLQWGGLFGVELNEYGEFELQGATVPDSQSEGESVEPMMALVDQDGRLLEIFKVDLQFLLEEDDEEEVSDPGSTPEPNPSPLLEEDDEEEASDPGSTPQAPGGTRLLEEDDEEEASDPGSTPETNPNHLLIENHGKVMSGSNL